MISKSYEKHHGLRPVLGISTRIQARTGKIQKMPLTPPYLSLVTLGLDDDFRQTAADHLKGMPYRQHSQIREIEVGGEALSFGLIAECQSFQREIRELGKQRYTTNREPKALSGMESIW